MHTAILLDGTKNPISIRFSEQDAGEVKSGQKKSISWSGSATTPARTFNFQRVVTRVVTHDDGTQEQREVLIYQIPGLKSDSRVLALRMKDLDADAEEGPVTLGQQAALLAEQFLYPEKFIEMGQSVAA